MLSLAEGAVFWMQTIISDHYFYCLFLKDTHEENISLRNQRPKFRSINLEMQGSCQSFYAGFACWHLVLAGVFCLFLILAKSSLCFAALGNMTVILILEAHLNWMVLTCGRQLGNNPESLDCSKNHHRKMFLPSEVSLWCHRGDRLSGRGKAAERLGYNLLD